MTEALALLLERDYYWQEGENDGLAFAESAQPCMRPAPKIGRNDPCLCGSGKKYKKCCLGTTAA